MIYIIAAVDKQSQCLFLTMLMNSCCMSWRLSNSRWTNRAESVALLECLDETWKYSNASPGTMYDTP